MNRLKYLDGLRGLAAMVVVLHHFMLAFYPATYTGNQQHSHFSNLHYDVFIAHSPLNIFVNGSFAVCIFFVLSGMVLSRQFLLTKNLEVISEQAARRYFRLIIPIFFSSLLAYLLVQFNLFSNKEVAVITKSDFWLAVLWQHKYTVVSFFLMGLVDIILTGKNSINNVLWTMATEFFGSFLVFATLGLTHFLRKRFLIYCLIIFGLIWINNYYYICFIAGIILMESQHSNDFKWLNNLKSSISISLLLVGLFLGSIPSGDYNSGGRIYHFLIWNIDEVVKSYIVYHVAAAILLVLAINNIKVLQKLLSTSFFTFLGKISFSIYLLHSLVLGSICMFLFLKIYPLMSYHWAASLVFVVFILMSILVSYFFAIYVDEKGTIVSKKIFTKFFKK